MEHPPAPSIIRSQYDKAARSKYNPYGMSDFNRHRIEIQSVTCFLTFAQDHSHEGAKNYRISQPGYAIFEICNEYGEIATCVLVKNTSIKEVSHAIECLRARTHGQK